MPSHSEAQILHQRDMHFHLSREVEDVASYLRSGGETIPNEPTSKITAYIGFLANRDYVNDGLLTGDKDSINRQIDAHLITPDNLSKGYFELQRRISLERGEGDNGINPEEITSEMREKAARKISADQRSSLRPWAHYLSGGDAGYGDWFRLYAFDGVLKMGKFDQQRGEFQKRSNSTTAPFPELARGALSMVHSWIKKSRVGEVEVDNHGEQIKDKNGDSTLNFTVKDIFDDPAQEEKFQKALKSGNFAKLYAHAKQKTNEGMITPEQRLVVEGSWKKYAQNSDPTQLFEDLQGFGLDWCTATGYETTTHHVQGGDFYVYYTKDQEGPDSVPRVAIRMENNEVVEVRGIAENQELEPVMANVLEEQLKDLPGGDTYIQKAEDMKRVTRIYTLVTDNPNVYLSKEDISFIYEFERTVEGFGYEYIDDEETIDRGRDPRLDEIRKFRGNLDHPDLKKLVIERIHEDFQASYAVYNTIVEQMQSLSIDTPVITQADMQELFSVKLSEWQERGVLDYAAERFIDNNELYTLIFRPNVTMTVDDLKALANDFAKLIDNCDETTAKVTDRLYDNYVNEEEIAILSGYKSNQEPVSMSLIPNKKIEQGRFISADDWLNFVTDLQKKSPQLNFNVPSLLDALTYWQNLWMKDNNIYNTDQDSSSLNDHSFALINLPPVHDTFEHLIPSVWIGDYMYGGRTNAVHLGGIPANFLQGIHLSIGR